ncbi:type IV toxin-antitoxin system AbiEi family antitoxin [Membranihabitans maritimus]|uniref:type IV toxin-antitoxin system AbiEi family antitoxin n=1 Tax=Membranihabitans maritimus TaxID=2904244 RepID=UPI001F3FC79F|nr:type IV toxin-antitoxin system AbiEi family antitoxin [Membranihabitans maritimus]
MDAKKGSKLNHLLQSLPSGIVVLSSWLVDKGYSYDLIRRYKKSNWFTSIGSGAIIRTGDNVGYEGAVYALQRQGGLKVHIGGRTALSLLGRAHYLDFDARKVFLFCESGSKLPAWFLNNDWGYKIETVNTSFLPPEMGLTSIDQKSFTIQIANPERAIMECLYLSQRVHSLLECYELMEGLNNLRPKEVQKLLENCNSVKVKRLFLFMAEKANHQWLNYVSIDNIDLGNGKRSFSKEKGVYDPKYQISLPEDLIK